MIKFHSLNHEANEFRDNDLVCYCFQYTKKRIEKDYIDNGHSTILERITLKRKLADVIVLRKIQKDVYVWLMSTRWWKE